MAESEATSETNIRRKRLTIKNVIRIGILIIIASIAIGLIVYFTTKGSNEDFTNESTTIEEESTTAKGEKDDARVTIVSRAGWGARPPNGFTTMSTPVLYVVVHHSFIPGACTTASACEAAMRSMQNMHMNTNGWADIGYNFAVGGDARAYEGRGWTRVGAHAPGFNDRSIGICTIGDWTTTLPPAEQLEALKELIKEGVDLGMIAKNYKLIGHRQTKPTECPGQTLFDEISGWPQFSPDLKAKNAPKVVENAIPS